MHALRTAAFRLRTIVRSRPAKALVVVAVAVVLVPALLYNAPKLTGSDHAFVVLSGSMEPTFSPGDVIFVDKVDPHALRVGDVVTFRVKAGGDTLVTHRVIEVIRDGMAVRYRTQGDANEDPDPNLVTPSLVVGVYQFHIPWWGLLGDVFRTKAGYGTLVAICGAVILWEMARLYRELDAWDRARRAKKEGNAQTTGTPPAKTLAVSAAMPPVAALARPEFEVVARRGAP